MEIYLALKMLPGSDKQHARPIQGAQCKKSPKTTEAKALPAAAAECGSISVAGISE